MVFEKKYTDDQILEAIDGGFKTTAFIMRKLGCTRPTATTYLEKLEKEGKVIKIEIDDGKAFIWRIKG